MTGSKPWTRLSIGCILGMVGFFSHSGAAFVITKTASPLSFSSSHLRSYKTMMKSKVDENNCLDDIQNDSLDESNALLGPSTSLHSTLDLSQGVIVALVGSAAIVAFLVYQPDTALAASKSLISTGSFNPDSFRPVCPSSDTFYRFLQITTQSVVGDDSFVQYGPLIAEGLLRIRLELCVVESYFNEAVGPFIQREGLSWVLPLHETVETFLAGTIFSLATTFILVGSTKIVSVLITYADFFIGGPCRLLGGFAYDRSRGLPVTLDVGFGIFKKRLIGPGDPKEDEMLKRKKYIEGSNFLDEVKEELDWSKVERSAIPIVVVSGGVKLFGESFKVHIDLRKEHVHMC
jgi:hypothetical protein